MVQTNIPEHSGTLTTNFAMPYSGRPCIADSLSHTTCVETNELFLTFLGSSFYRVMMTKGDVSLLTLACLLKKVHVQ